MALQETSETGFDLSNSEPSAESGNWTRIIGPYTWVLNLNLRNVDLFAIFAFPYIRLRFSGSVVEMGSVFPLCG